MTEMKDNRNGGVTWFARFVEKEYSISNYEGPFSDIHELHAAEWGFRAGLTAGIARDSAQLATIVGSLSVLKGAKDTASGGRPKWVRRNGSYAVLFALVGFVVGRSAMAATETFPSIGL